MRPSQLLTAEKSIEVIVKAILGSARHHEDLYGIGFAS